MTGASFGRWTRSATTSAASPTSGSGATTARCASRSGAVAVTTLPRTTATPWTTSTRSEATRGAISRPSRCASRALPARPNRSRRSRTGGSASGASTTCFWSTQSRSWCGRRPAASPTRRYRRGRCCSCLASWRFLTLDPRFGRIAARETGSTEIINYNLYAFLAALLSIIGPCGDACGQTAVSTSSFVAGLAIPARPDGTAVVTGRLDPLPLLALEAKVPLKARRSCALVVRSALGPRDAFFEAPPAGLAARTGSGPKAVSPARNADDAEATGLVLAAALRRTVGRDLALASPPAAAAGPPNAGFEASGRRA